MYITAQSNFSGAIAAAGAYHGVGPYGTVDMAGNVREWCLNRAGPDRRFVLGGSASSPTYLYDNPEALSPFDRTAANGFRCVRNSAPLAADVTAPRTRLERDFATFHPASDDTFRIYRTLYAYDKTPLHAVVDRTDDARDWTRQKISFDAAYGRERVPMFLFLPKRVRPPFQTVVFFPSARVEAIASSDQLGDLGFVDYVIESGRAVAYPIYQATYERLSQDDRERGTALPQSSRGRDLMIQLSKDLGRTVDYLQTRPDLDPNKIGYLGVSMGTAYGVILATLEERLTPLVFLDGGYFLDKPLPGADQADFAPRLRRPVLMVNGRYDYVFSLEASQRPLFNMLGTPAADKRHFIVDTPHDVMEARGQVVPVVLEWLDKYLGKVR
jgi:eukaryotic-like serine/threonine-protein kinase